MWWCEVTYVVVCGHLCHLCGGACPYVTYVVAFKFMSPMWWCVVTYVVAFKPMSPMWWCVVIYVTYVVAFKFMSPMWWCVSLCHVCGGILTYVTFVVVCGHLCVGCGHLCHLCGGACPYVTYVVAF